MKTVIQIMLSLLVFIIATLSANAQELNVIDATATMYNDLPAVAIVFDNSIDVKSSYDDYIKVSLNGKNEQTKGIVDKDLHIIYYTGLLNGKNYVISVTSGLKADDGSRLKSDFRKSITTNSLQPSAWFSSPGMVLVPSDRAVIPITVSNLDTIMVNFYRTSVDKNKNWFRDAANRTVRSYNIDAELERQGYKLITSRSYDVKALNMQTSTNIDIPKELFADQGVYAAVIQYAGGYENVPITNFIISDIGLQIRRYVEDSSVSVWARSISTGQALSGVQLNMLYESGDGSRVQTDSSGFAKLSFLSDKKRPLLLMASKGNDYAIVNMSRPLDLSEFDISGKMFRKNKIFVYGSRDIYRGGETGRWNVLVRNHDGVFADPGPINIKLISPRGQVVDNSTVTLDKDYGYYEYEHAFENSAPTGNWRIIVTAGQNYEEHSLAIEDFLPETMRLTLGKPDDPLIVSKQRATTIDILGEYLYGAPAAGNRVDGTYAVRSAVHISGKWRDYAFFDEYNDSNASSNSLKDIKLDNNGQGQWDISGSSAFKIEKDLSPVSIRYLASLYTSGGKSVNRNKEFIYFPAGVALGVKADFKKYASTTGNNTFSIINLDSNGELANAKVSITLIKEDRNYYWDYNQNYGWRSNFTSVSYPVQSKQIELGAKPEDVVLRMDRGYYRLEVKNLSNNQKVVYTFNAGNYWWDDDSDSFSMAKPESLVLTLNKPAYSVNDTALVNITSPYDGSGKLFVETGAGMLWSKDITVKNKTAKVEIPIKQGWDRHDTYISAYLARPEKELEKTQKGVILGILHLPFDREKRKIELTITNPASVEPGKEFEVIIQAANPTKYVGNTLVTLAATDEGVLALKRFETPDAWTFFFARLMYYPTIWDNFWQIVHKYSSKMATRYGGDMMDMAMLAKKGGELARSDVKIVSSLTHPIFLDSKGQAKVKMTIPSFNGELRLMAMAFSKDSYGMGQSMMKVAEPIVTELSMPRFLATGDVTDLALDVQNMTGADQNLTIVATTTDGIVLNNIKTFSKQVSLKQSDKAIVSIPVKAAGTSGYGNINIYIKGYKSGIQKSWRLAMRPPYPAVTVSKTFALSPKVTADFFKIKLGDYVEDSAYFALTIDSTPPMGLNEQFRHLLEYPYGCLEQSVSSTFPHLYATNEILQKYNVPSPYKTKSREATINAGINRILAKQLSSGGFGYWDSTSYESHWGTVYATEFLNEAQKQGYKVDQNALNKANSRLLYYLRNSWNSNYSSYYDNSGVYVYSVNAYAAYVLSKVGKISLSDVRALSNRTIPSPLYGYLLAIALKNTGDESKALEIIDDSKNHVISADHGYYGDYRSNVRDNAWIIALAKEYSGSSNEYMPMLTNLADTLREKNWLSTQERVRLFMLAYAIQGTESVKGQLTINNAKKMISTTDGYNASWKAQTLEKGVSFTSDVDYPLYARTDFIAYTKKAPEKLSDNATIVRNYYTINGEKRSIDNVKTGEYVMVELICQTSINTTDALIVDLLPAGFELENPNLDNSMKMNRNYNAKSATYSEYRDDRFVAAMAVNKGSKRSLYYLMRAVTPGVYVNSVPYLEDMYRGNIRAVGEPTPARITITEK